MSPPQPPEANPAGQWPSNDKVAEWIAWLKGDLFQAVHGLCLAQKMWSGYNQILDVMPHEARTPGLFHGWIKANHVTTAVMAIRRLLDKDQRTISLAVLLTNLIDNAEAVERDPWMAALRGFMREEGIRAAWEPWGGVVGNHLDPAIVKGDCDRLFRETEKLRTYADKYVAHMDLARMEFDTQVTFGEVEAIVDLIYGVYKKYADFLGHSSLVDLTLPPWEHVFKVAWDQR